MPAPHLDFQQTWLWKHIFVDPRDDSKQAEQEYFRNQFIQMREKVSSLVALIGKDMPGMTVHDLTHLDALWETASIVSEGAITLSPAEGFVFGASILLHDAGMTIAAYPKGISEIQETTTWKDMIARWVQTQQMDECEFDIENPSEDVVKQILPEVLRRLHAEQAVALAEQAWTNENGEQQYLIEDSDLRNFYGKAIGEIAHSHWWSVPEVEQKLSQNLGAFPQQTKSQIDKIKLAALLRIADALHLDQLRAPRFLRTLTQPQGLSATHWTFQEKMASPMIESDSIVFTAAQPFEQKDADAWWLAYDTLELVDHELRNVDLLLQERGGKTLNARRVKGIESPEAFSNTVQTKNWRPVDTRIKVSDVPRIVESLGGAKLYGNDPHVPLRELIQNAADAVQARRRLEKRADDWGEIRISIEDRDDGHWLLVEDNGIGMSELVLTGPLLDFGTSFWHSSLIMDEFPGLVASGMKSIGQFGIGFFSVFMLGKVVRVISQRYDKGNDTARVLEFNGGPAGRPVLYPAASQQAPLDGGSRVEVLLKDKPYSKNGILEGDRHDKDPLSLARLTAELAPSLDVSIAVKEGSKLSIPIKAGDWLTISKEQLLGRLCPRDQSASTARRLRELEDDNGTVYGRGAISAGRYGIPSDHGWVTVSGLSAKRLANVDGILAGNVTTASRDSAIPIVPKRVLAEWATNQAKLLNESQIHDEIKSRAAEVILECRGDIGSLPIVQWGDEWLGEDEFSKRISNEEELTIQFEGEFEYDEGLDNMLPRDFNSWFELNEKLIMATRHNGNIIRESGLHWPSCLYDEGSSGSKIAELVRSIINTCWSDYLGESEEERIVGDVMGEDVMRTVSIFTRYNSDDI